MKIRILKNILVEIEKTHLSETWDKNLFRGTELHVENIYVDGKTATITTYDGDVIKEIPVDAFEVVK